MGGVFLKNFNVRGQGGNESIVEKMKSKQQINNVGKKS